MDHIEYRIQFYLPINSISKSVPKQTANYQGMTKFMRRKPVAVTTSLGIGLMGKTR